MKKLLALSLLLISLSSLAQKNKIALNLKKDSTYYLTSNANFTIIEDLPGQQMVITTLIDGRAAHKIIATADSLYEMEVSYTRLSFSFTVAGKTVTLDSDDKNPANPFAKVMTAMMNKPFNMTVSRSGKVIEVKNMDNIYADAFKSVPQISEAQQVQFKKQMEQSFGSGAVKKNFQDAFAMFPTNTVGLNDTWSANSNTQSIIAINEKITYRLKEITDKNYIISGESVITSADNSDFRQYNGITMRYSNVGGSTSSQLELDKKTGWIVEAKISKQIKATVDVKNDPQAKDVSATFPMTIAGDLTMSNK